MTAFTIPVMLSLLPERWRWTLHNVIAHPLSEVLYQVGARRASDWIHDHTVPSQSAEPRG